MSCGALYIIFMYIIHQIHNTERQTKRDSLKHMYTIKPKVLGNDCRQSILRILRSLHCQQCANILILFYFTESRDYHQF